MNLRLLVSKQLQTSKIRCNRGPFPWQQRSLSAGLFIGLLVCFSTPKPSYAEMPEERKKKDGYCDASARKKVLSNYSVIGIPGDGRCLFRSVAHGACIRAGKPVPNETLQRELADELRAKIYLVGLHGCILQFNKTGPKIWSPSLKYSKVHPRTQKANKEEGHQTPDSMAQHQQGKSPARRRSRSVPDSLWFIEGDFDAYVSQMRKPHIWGDEPELLMASHILHVHV